MIFYEPVRSVSTPPAHRLIISYLSIRVTGDRYPKMVYPGRPREILGLVQSWPFRASGCGGTNND